jgi:pimeloyl-ACP methyl ester carboxylesterase
MRLLPIALCLAFLACAAPAAASDLTWRDCDDGFQCATAKVPLDYDKPHGTKVRLAVIRHPALDQEHRIGSVFVNNGGPGMSAVDFVRTAPPPAFPLLSRFDVVAFDPRGVGGSDPAVDCDDVGPFAPMTPDTFDLRTLLDRGRAIARRCLNRDPAFLASLTTGNAARDMDRLRAAVGDKKLNYLGLSWGGMLGETYTSLFPGRTRAILLDAPVDGDVWINRPLDAYAEHRAGFEDSLDRFLAFAGRSEDSFEALLAGPYGEELRATAFGSFYDRPAWEPLAAALDALEGGDPGPLRALRHEVADPPLLLDLVQTYGSVEQRWPHRRLAPYLDAAEHQFAVAPHFAAGAYEDVHNLFWPVRPRGAFYGPFRHSAKAPPVLVVGGTHDPAAPYAWSRRVVRDLGNARLLTYHGDGHGAVVEFNPCVLGALVPYLNELELPPEGASCDQEVTARAARRASAAAPWSP